MPLERVTKQWNRGAGSVISGTRVSALADLASLLPSEATV